MSGLVKISGFASSMQGGRSENQDDLGFLDTPLGFLFVLCDGMGGGPGGKTASFIVKQTIARSLSACNSLTSVPQALADAFCKAQEALADRMSEDPSLKGMGSTAVVVLVNKKSAFVAHTGDSRFYHISRGRLQWRTTDHSLVSELVQTKALTEEQARVSPQSNVITRALGATNNHTPDIKEIRYEKGDRFVVCTDGVWGSMPSASLLKKLSTVADSSVIVTALQDEVDVVGVQKGGGHDNHSIAIIDLNENSQKTNLMVKKLKGIIAVLLFLIIVFFVAFIFSLFRDNKDVESMQESIHNLERQLDDYKRKYDAATKAADGNTKDLILEKVILEGRVDSLIGVNSLLSNKVDTLTKTVRALRANATQKPSQGFKFMPKTTSATKTESAKANGTKKVTDVDDTPAEELQKQIVKEFDNIINCKKKDLTSAVNYVNTCYREIEKQLTQLTQKVVSPENKQKLEDILKNIKRPDNEKNKIDKADGEGNFKPTYIARDFAKNCREKIKNIKLK